MMMVERGDMQRVINADSKKIKKYRGDATRAGVSHFGVVENLNVLNGSIDIASLHRGRT